MGTTDLVRMQMTVCSGNFPLRYLSPSLLSVRDRVLCNFWRRTPFGYCGGH